MASGNCTVALFQAFYQSQSLSQDVWNITLWLTSRKGVCYLQRPLQNQLTTQINADMVLVSSVARIMEKQVVDAFNEPIHHRQD